MQKVLIPIDYHPVSEKIADAGYALAKKLGAQTCLMHVIGDVRYYNMNYPDFFGNEGFGEVFNPEMASEVTATAEKFMTKAAKHLHNNVETHIGRGEASTHILAYAEKWQADIIVMGTHSHSIFEKLLMGSVATKVIENSKIPVYLIPVKK